MNGVSTSGMDKKDLQPHAIYLRTCINNIS